MQESVPNGVVYRGLGRAPEAQLLPAQRAQGAKLHANGCSLERMRAKSVGSARVIGIGAHLCLCLGKGSSREHVQVFFSERLGEGPNAQAARRARQRDPSERAAQRVDAAGALRDSRRDALERRGGLVEQIASLLACVDDEGPGDGRPRRGARGQVEEVRAAERGVVGAQEGAAARGECGGRGGGCRRGGSCRGSGVCG